MATQPDLSPGRPAVAVGDGLISADSHVSEPRDLWAKRMPARLRDRVPDFASERSNAQHHPGGQDPNARLEEMTVDGVAAEVIYPTVGMRMFQVEDPEAQEAGCKAYNDWITEYCSVLPDRLAGIALISAHDLEGAIAELERCRKMGLRGAMIWEAPPPEIAYSTDHHEPFWAAAEALDMPVTLHILTTHDEHTRMHVRQGLNVYRGTVNWRLTTIIDSLFDIIFTGVLERHPRLKIVLAEHEIGWIPFVVQQWDKAYFRQARRAPLDLPLTPSEYFNRQVYATFFNDAAGGYLIGRYGQDNFMWSNDYPHQNSTWPNSREVIARDLAHLSPETVNKVTRENVARLYGFKL